MTVLKCALSGALLTFALMADDASIARGKYLVNEVAKCGMCHTPAGADGKADESKSLKGGPINLQPVQPVAGWHKNAPDLTSGGRLWQRWGEAGLVKFLETGLGPSGNPAGAPMPTYKMSHEDAQAVVDYLHTLQ